MKKSKKRPFTKQGLKVMQLIRMEAMGRPRKTKKTPKKRNRYSW